MRRELDVRPPTTIYIDQARRCFSPREAEAALALTRPPERWGWMYVEPDSRRLSPERNRPPEPVRVRPKLILVVSLSILWMAAYATAYALIPAATNWMNQHPSTKQLNPYSGIIVLAPIATFIGTILAWKRIFPDRSGQFGGRGPWYQRGLFVFLICLALTPLALILAVFLIAAEVQRYRAQHAYDTEVASWQARIVAYERSEDERFATAKRYFPAYLSTPSAATLTFGGSPVVWERSS